MQLDYDALLVLEIGDGAALNDRDAGGDRRIVAGEIRRTGQIIDFTLGVDSSCANVRDRYARQLERVLLLVFAVVKSAVSPGVSYAHGDRAAAIPHVARGYRSGCNRRRGGVCRHSEGRQEKSGSETEDQLTHEI